MIIVVEFIAADQLLTGRTAFGTFFSRLFTVTVGLVGGYNDFFAVCNNEDRMCNAVSKVPTTKTQMPRQTIIRKNR